MTLPDRVRAARHRSQQLRAQSARLTARSVELAERAANSALDGAPNGALPLAGEPANP